MTPKGAFMRMRVLAGLSLASLLCAQSLPEMRILPAEMRGGAVDGNQIGSSGLAGVHTKVLFGDPSKAGFYSILLFVPAQNGPTDTRYFDPANEPKSKAKK